jgi:hypothetical protein
MDFMVQLTWNSIVSIQATIYFLTSHCATYFTAVSENKNALSEGKNIGFNHVLNEKLSCGSVAQQQKHIWDLEGVNKTPLDLLFLTSINNLRVLSLNPHIKCHSNYPI